MLDKILKKYFKDKVFVCNNFGMVMSYKVNVNCKVGKYYDGGEYRSIDLNIKVINCIREIGLSPVFGGGKRIKMTYDDVKLAIRADLNNRVSPTFPIYLFGGGVFKRVGNRIQIRINRYTYC